MGIFEDLDAEYRKYDDWMGVAVDAEMAEKPDPIKPGERFYNDIKGDYLLSHFKNDIQKEFGALSAESKNEAIANILEEAEGELTDCYSERDIGRALHLMVLIESLKKNVW